MPVLPTIDLDPLVRRQGGSSADWKTAGTTNYTQSARVQCGSKRVSIPLGDSAVAFTITLPEAFGGTPVIWFTLAADGDVLSGIAATATEITGTLTMAAPCGASFCLRDFYWLAMGGPP